MSLWRPEFEAALRLLARVSAAMDEAGVQPPVLVGGAAVELYTAGAISTGDFDLSTGRHDVFDRIVPTLGFVRPSGAGMSTRGWVHPELKLGFEVVSGTLLEGNADRDRVRIVSVGEGEVAVISVEDMIADRMGQYASGTAVAMLGQAQALFRLSDGLDLAYLEERIRTETLGEHGVQDLHSADRADHA